MTRAEYMEKSTKENHHKYFMQFASRLESACEQFWKNIPIKELTKFYLEDQHLNNIHKAYPNQYALKQFDFWADFHSDLLRRIAKQYNDSYAPYYGACILKAYAKQKVIEHMAAEVAEQLTDEVMETVKFLKEHITIIHIGDKND